MKTKITILLLTFTFWIPAFAQLANKTCDMEFLNLVQTNETEFRFDVRIRNTTPNPTVDDPTCTDAGGAFAIDAWNFYVGFNPAILNGGALSPGFYLFYQASSSQLATSIIPDNALIGSDQTCVIAFPNSLGLNVVTTILNHSNWVKIGTFIVKLRNVNDNLGTPSVAHNFASVLPNFFTPSNAYNKVGYVPYNVLNSRRTLGATGGVTTTVINNLGNKSLYSHCYSGSGGYNDGQNWNNNVASTDPSYQKVPSITTNNVAVGSINFDEVTTFADVSKSGTCNIDADITVSDLTVNAGSQLTLLNGSNMTATNFYINSDAVKGTGTFVDKNASVSSGKLTVSGLTNVQQYLPMGRNWYISSPVSGATSNVIKSTSANKLWNYNEVNTGTILWNEITATNTLLGITTGYVANMAASGNILFPGTLNTGAQTTVTLTRQGTISSGFNLVGNPYPSYLNWISAVASTNTGTINMEPTMWYRSQNSGATYVFDTFIANGSGGGIGTSNFSNGVTPVNGFIPPMQAFWVRVAPGQTTGKLAFTNSMRSHQDQSIPTNRLKAASIVDPEQSVLRLQVSNGINSDEAIVYFNPNALDTFDGFDAEKMSNNDATIPEIYTMAGLEKVVINGLKSVYDNEELMLGFTPGIQSDFTIKATEISSFDPNTKIILKDKLLNTEKELTIGNSYTFSSTEISTLSRFSILFKTTSVTTQINDDGKGSESMLIYKNQNNQITVNRMDAIGEGTLTVSNSIGQLLASQSTTGTVTVVDKTLIPGVYLVKLTLKGKNTIKKVIIN